MDPVTLVESALAAGAGAGLKDTASAVVRDTYTGLKEAVAERFRGRPAAEVALQEHQSNPQTWEAPLRTYLTETGVDDQMLGLAQQLLTAVQPAGSTHTTAKTIQGGQWGDGNTQTNTFTS